MKKCRNIEADLSALIDGELTGQRQAEVIAHVDHCPDCTRRIGELQRLASGIDSLPKLEPPTQFLADIQGRLRPAWPLVPWKEKFFQPFWPKVPLAALAAMAVVASVVWFAQPERPRPMIAKMEKPLAVPNQAVKAHILPVEIVPAPDAAKGEVKLTDTDLLTKSFVETGAVVDTAGGMAAGRKLVDAVRVEPPAPVIVRGESLVAVRLCVTDLAKTLNGQLAAITLSNTFIVHLPRRNVGAFRTAMSHLQKSESMYSLSPGPTATAARTDAPPNQPADASPADTAIDLEVIVEPADP